MPRTISHSLSIWIFFTGSAAFSQTLPDSKPGEPGSIIGYAPNTNMRDPSDRSVPIRLVDPDRVKPRGEMHFTETPEQQADRLALPCQNVVYRNACVSGCFVFIFGGTPPGNN